MLMVAITIVNHQKQTSVIATMVNYLFMVVITMLEFIDQTEVA